ncbi:helix-turn-helix transcriptional regulator [Stutzerimonas stutzeri]|uniref:helix-turn-helix transcriptional regulator n=1 Tax=Stutzerimonas stutzeri TaxID=316 RepID=UPI001BCECC88|nr:helix-turn-helix transcriptional regulator [Stutzerimonas stutzeri]
MEIFISIGERLREVRVAMGKSQTEFAEIAAAAGVPGATRQSQANYEKGRQMPSAAYLAAIAAAGADVLYVVTGQRAPILTNQSYTTTSPHMTENANPVTHSVAAEPLGEYRLNRREKALLENYRGSDEEGRRAMESTASALAHRDGAKKKGRQGGE